MYQGGDWSGEGLVLGVPGPRGCWSQGGGVPGPREVAGPGGVPGLRGGGACSQGVWYPSMHWGRPPCGQNSLHTFLKILPCPKLRLQAVNILWCNSRKPNISEYIGVHLNTFPVNIHPGSCPHVQNLSWSETHVKLEALKRDLSYILCWPWLCKCMILMFWAPPPAGHLKTWDIPEMLLWFTALNVIFDMGNRYFWWPLW